MSELSCVRQPIVLNIVTPAGSNICVEIADPDTAPRRHSSC